MPDAVTCTSAGIADPVETHAYLNTSEGEESAKKALDRGEQTCLLHALCRSDLKTRIRVDRI